MVDRYTKIVLTIIAVALVWLGVRPVIAPDTVRIDGVVEVESARLTGVKVNCVSGCK